MKLKTFLLLPLLLMAMLTFSQDKRCKATKKDGTPCKMKVAENKSYCQHHDPNTPKCGAATSTGARCKMKVAKDGDFCQHHENKIIKMGDDGPDRISLVYRQNGKKYALDYLTQKQVDSLKKVLQVD